MSAFFGRGPRSRRAILACALGAAGVAHAAGSIDPPAPAEEPSARLKAMMEAAFARADANGDSRLSPAEAEHLPAIAAKFKVLDRDHDGALTLAEFAVGYSASE